MKREGHTQALVLQEVVYIHSLVQLLLTSYSEGSCRLARSSSRGNLWIKVVKIGYYSIILGAGMASRFGFGCGRGQEVKS